MDWNKFFFSDVGKKIKAIIRGIFYTEVILTIVAGVVLELKAFVNLLSGETEFFLVILAIPVGALVIIGALWLSTLLTYGFGEIVDTAIINRKEQLTPAPKKTAPEKPAQPEKVLASQPVKVSVSTPKPEQEEVYDLCIGNKWCPLCDTVYAPHQVFCKTDNRYLKKITEKNIKKIRDCHKSKGVDKK